MSALYGEEGLKVVLSAFSYWQLKRATRYIFLLGDQVFHVLRPQGDGFHFVSEAYVYGLMNGEALLWLENGMT